MTAGDGDVVHEAKAHGAVGQCVMPGRPHDRERPIDAALDHGHHAVQGGAGREHSRVVAALGKVGVGVEPPAVLLGDDGRELVEIRRRVDALELGPRGRSGRDRGGAGEEVARDELALDRGHTPRMFGVASDTGRAVGLWRRDMRRVARIDGQTDLHGGSLPRRNAAAIALFVGTFAACLLVAPREVNGDGIGYIKAARDGALYPGHLAYLPLLRAAWHAAVALGLCGMRLADVVWPGRVLSAMGAGTAATLLYLVIERREGVRPALVAGVGLAASAGLLGAGCDLESYAPALAALLGVVWALDRDRVTLGALLLSLATLLHVENALFGLAALTLTRSRCKLAAVAAGATLIAYLGSGMLASLPRSSHGFVYPLHAYTPLVAMWGALRALVFVPYPYEASLAHVVAATVVALGFAAVLRPVRSISGPSLYAWLVPYALVGLVFFPSDPERWIFVLPLVWLTARPRAIVVLLLAAVNVALWLPHARDTRGIDAASRAATHLAPHDLVLMPGHGWDESLALVADDIQPFPFVYHAAARGGAQGVGVALEEALRAASRVVSVRLDAEGLATDVSGTLGYKELSRWGLDRAALRELLRAHGLSPAGSLGNGVTLWTR